MKVKHDRRVAALKVELSPEPWAYTEDVSRGQHYERGLDDAQGGTLIGVEFQVLNVTFPGDAFTPCRRHNNLPWTAAAW